jgi:hypothetical protein
LFVLSTSVPCPTDIPPIIPYKFSRAANLFLVVTWYCYPSFNFLIFDLSIYISLTARLLTASFFLTSASTQKWSVSHSERSGIKYTGMPSPVYQNVINFVVHLSLKTGPSVFMNVAMRQHGAFDNQVFKCDKVYYSNSIIIAIFLWTLIPDCRFENICLLLHWNHPWKFSHCT